MAKPTDAQVIEAYNRLGNVWATASELGTYGQYIHRVCVRLGINKSIKTYQKWQGEFIEKNYKWYADRHKLTELSEIVCASKSDICAFAKKKGLTKSKRRINLLSKSHYSLNDIYRGIVSRCNNPKNASYHNYGGRGIECRLGSLKEFQEKMGETYVKGLSIDRIDNNGHYEYGNLQWANQNQQSRNTRRSIYVLYKNERRLLIELAEEKCIRYDTLYNRIFKHKWDINDAVDTKVRRSQNL